MTLPANRRARDLRLSVAHHIGNTCRSPRRRRSPGRARGAHGAHLPRLTARRPGLDKKRPVRAQPAWSARPDPGQRGMRLLPILQVDVHTRIGAPGTRPATTSGLRTPTCDAFVAAFARESPSGALAALCRSSTSTCRRRSCRRGGRLPRPADAAGSSRAVGAALARAQERLRADRDAAALPTIEDAIRGRDGLPRAAGLKCGSTKRRRPCISSWSTRARSMALGWRPRRPLRAGPGARAALPARRAVDVGVLSVRPCGHRDPLLVVWCCGATVTQPRNRGHAVRAHADAPGVVPRRDGDAVMCGPRRLSDRLMVLAVHDDRDREHAVKGRCGATV